MNTFSKKITEKEACEIKEYLLHSSADFDVVQYAKWRAKVRNFQVIYYSSGKLLVQGKDISEFTDKFFKNNIISQKNDICSFNEKYIGTDESGKGDFFGPLVASAVQVNEENKQLFIDLGIKDSKKLDDKKILELAPKIKANASHSVVVIMPQKYNELYMGFKNLNKLLAWAHARAIENVLDKSPCNYALADKFGDESLIKNALLTKGKNIELKQMVRAEADIAVACASVLARAEFVKRIREMENKYEMSFPKGVSENVINQAKEYVSKYSFERLNEVAKMHFKTVMEIK